MINLLVARSWDAAGRLGVEQDLEGLLEPAGAVTARDECGMDRPPGGAGLAGFPAHRVDLLLGGQDGRGDDAGLGSAGRARGVGTGRGPVRNYQRRPEFVDCVRMVHLRRDFQPMIDRGGDGEPIGRRLLGMSNRLFRSWHRVRDGTLPWEAFQARMRRLRREVRQALEEGSRCAGAKTAATCFEILKVEEGLWSFARVRGIEPTNNAAERALRLYAYSQPHFGKVTSPTASSGSGWAPVVPGITHVSKPSAMASRRCLVGVSKLRTRDGPQSSPGSAGRGRRRRRH
jgi:hypothetical protein